jgi:serine/threonine-protein kinase
VDKRADIWAFGVVVYEMLTGQRAFKGEDISDTLAYIITKEPDWSALPADTPPAIHQLLRRCLAKDRKRRLADIADARFELDEAAQPAATPSGAGTAAAFEPTEPTGAAWLLPWVVAAIATAVAFAAILVGAPGRTIPPRTLAPERGFRRHVSTNGPGSPIEISPDGTTIAFIGEGPNGPELFLRHLNQLTAMRRGHARGG